MSNFLSCPGFLGTHATFISDLTLILILLTAIMFTIGWQLARHKHYKAHRWLQTVAACLNAVVVLAVNDLFVCGPHPAWDSGQAIGRLLWGHDPACFRGYDWPGPGDIRGPAG